MSETLFHPAVARWFAGRFPEPTPVQSRAWPAIHAGRHALLAAPTGSGKTLAAFLAVIDQLVRDGEVFGLPDETRVLYISPLKALSNDIQVNLEEPLAGIRDQLGPLSPLEIRTAVRTGDTPASERARMRRQSPHILVTTPESLYILLTSESGRAMLQSVRTVIVDELHAVANNKRGAHLALSLERLAALCERPLARIGISATQKPMQVMADFLLGAREESCDIVDTGHVRERDLALEMPRSALQPIMATEVWAEIYDRLAELAGQHRTTLIFVNTRRRAERAARHLAERLGEEAVAAHHGSLAKEHRLSAEQRLKSGQLKALVATASLELGIDIGDIDLVCQLGSPHAIATFLQRVGRSGHGVQATPKGRLFPLSRDDLVQSAALLQAVSDGELDRLQSIGPALDVLSQQVVAETAARDWQAEELFEQFRRAHPYRNLAREQFDVVIRMLAEGYHTRRGRRGRFLHLDAVNGRLRGRRGSRLTAMTNGGAIPDQFDYDVRLLPADLSVGSLNEDFAFESLPGDIFQLGNLSYRVLKVETGTVFVEDAHGAPPSIPFWFGEAPGRTDELSHAVSELRAAAATRLAAGDGLDDWLQQGLGLPPAAASQLGEYLAMAHAALNGLPTRRSIIFERFLDELGDMHLVIHSPFGSRLNRAWGLALRKRFCRKFNFELQAAALEDSIVLSLGPTHSFPLEEVARYLNSGTVREVLTQALLTAPVFPTRWRWAATTALAIRRNRNGKKVPPQWQRSDAEDLLAVIFPDQLACAENLAGDREVPDHPLVEQAMYDCLHDLMDVAGLERLLTDIEQGEVTVLARDLTTPSPLAQEIINARPYAFLDDAPAEERRTRAIQSRHLLDAASAAELARPDAAAIAAVQAEAWPLVRDADELHDALVLSGFLTAAEGGAAWQGHFDGLCAGARAAAIQVPGGECLWVATERLAQIAAVLPAGVVSVALPDLPVPAGQEPLVELLRSRLETLGPVTAATLGQPLNLDINQINLALQALEIEGFIIQGNFRSAPPAPVEWCERRLLARIHRRTLQSLRKQVEPVSPATLMRFLFRRHGLTGERGEGAEALREALRRLRGFPVPAACWESQLLPLRADAYVPADLDALVSSGELAWFRPAPSAKASAVRNTPIALVPRADLGLWRTALAAGSAQPELSGVAERLRDCLRTSGALFFEDLVTETGLLPTQAQTALGEMVAQGLVTCDGFQGLRALVRPKAARRRRRGPGIAGAGRWSLVRAAEPDAGDVLIEAVARALLDRYGVIFRALLQRESRHLPPWRELVRSLRRMEARGDVRGGRFVNGFGGEQFAWPGAVAALRRARTADQDLEVVVPAVDPLNLTGVITPGDRVPGTPRNRVLYRGGEPIAVQVGGNFRALDQLDAAAEWSARHALVRNDPRLPYLQPPARSI